MWRSKLNPPRSTISTRIKKLFGQQSFSGSLAILSTVRSRYIMGIFLGITPERHPTARRQVEVWGVDFEWKIWSNLSDSNCCFVRTIKLCYIESISQLDRVHMEWIIRSYFNFIGVYMNVLSLYDWHYHCKFQFYLNCPNVFYRGGEIYSPCELCLNVKTKNNITYTISRYLIIVHKDHQIS